MSRRDVSRVPYDPTTSLEFLSQILQECRNSLDVVFTETESSTVPRSQCDVACGGSVDSWTLRQEPGKQTRVMRQNFW
jgi:hypothetical protein